MHFSVTILGNNSAIPTLLRNTAAQVVNHNHHYFLIDCGDGTQMQLLKNRIKMQRINHIFISHMHGDHFFGLIGLISSNHLMNRKKPLYIYAPADLKLIIDMQLEKTNTTLKYPLVFKAISPEHPETIFENDMLIVKTIPLSHSVPATGFLFQEKTGKRKIRTDLTETLNIPVEAFRLLQRGKDYVDMHGTEYLSEELTTDPAAPRSYAYCSDTAYDERILPYIRHVSLLFHEATFTNDFEKVAAEKFHSTAKQAARIAQKAEAKKLLLGHFSNRYDDTKPLVDEAREIFPETDASEEGTTYQV